MNELQHSLESMGLVQYLFAIAFLICYALVIGNFLGDASRGHVAWLGLLSGIGFASSSDFWVHGVLLLAFAVIGLGMFLGVTWLLKALFASAVGEASGEAVFDDAVSVSNLEGAPLAWAAEPDAREAARGRFLPTDRPSLDQRAS